MAFNKFRGPGGSDKFNKFGRQRGSDAADVRVRGALDEVASGQRAERLRDAKHLMKTRCERAATFRKTQEVFVDNMAGTGVVTDIDTQKRGVVFVKHPGMIDGRSYPAEAVHLLDELKEKGE